MEGPQPLPRNILELFHDRIDASTENEADIFNVARQMGVRDPIKPLV